MVISLHNGCDFDEILSPDSMSYGEGLKIDTRRIKIAMLNAIFPFELLHYYPIEKLIVKHIALFSLKFGRSYI
jgi:hypothetical protein